MDGDVGRDLARSKGLVWAIGFWDGNVTGDLDTLGSSRVVGVLISAGGWRTVERGVGRVLAESSGLKWMT